MNRRQWLCSAMAAALAPALPVLAQGSQPALFPAAGAANVNPDTPLKLTFSRPPVVGKSGKIRVYDAADDRLVDTLDLAIPAGPTERVTGEIAPYLAFPYPYARTKRATNRDTKPGTPTAGAAPTPDRYQLTIIGGFTDGFHFYPVLVDGNTATIQLHHDLLDHGRTYYVQIDPRVIQGFGGVSGKAWRFSTKARGPARGARRITVAADGKGDFNTLQGAIDFTPDHGKQPIVIDVAPGLYQEIVYFRNKANLTIQGRDRDATIIRYANNEVFNPHPSNISTNEVPGTFPSRRAAVAADNCTAITFRDITLHTTAPGQAEGLLMTGERNILDNVSVIGAGDALQVNGSTYMRGGMMFGTGDTILGRGPCYFERVLLKSTRVFMWIRNTDANHGNVFKHCTFIATQEPTDLVRSPDNRKGYPYAEAVFLHSTMVNISPEGFGAAHTGGKIRFWEFDSRDASGRPLDVSRRAKWSRQLDAARDAKVIADYSDPAFVLGWKPDAARLRRA